MKKSWFPILGIIALTASVFQTHWLPPQYAVVVIIFLAAFAIIPRTPAMRIRRVAKESDGILRVLFKGSNTRAVVTVAGVVLALLIGALLLNSTDNRRLREVEIKNDAVNEIAVGELESRWKQIQEEADAEIFPLAYQLDSKNLSAACRRAIKLDLIDSARSLIALVKSALNSNLVDVSQRQRLESVLDDAFQLITADEPAVDNATILGRIAGILGNRQEWQRSLPILDDAISSLNESPEEAARLTALLSRLAGATLFEGDAKECGNLLERADKIVAAYPDVRLTLANIQLQDLKARVAATNHERLEIYENLISDAKRVYQSDTTVKNLIACAHIHSQIADTRQKIWRLDMINGAQTHGSNRPICSDALRIHHRQAALQIWRVVAARTGRLSHLIRESEAHKRLGLAHMDAGEDLEAAREIQAAADGYESAISRNEKIEPSALREMGAIQNLRSDLQVHSSDFVSAIAHTAAALDYFRRSFASNPTAQVSHDIALTHFKRGGIFSKWAEKTTKKSELHQLKSQSFRELTLASKLYAELGQSSTLSLEQLDAEIEMLKRALSEAKDNLASGAKTQQSSGPTNGSKKGASS